MSAMDDLNAKLTEMQGVSQGPERERLVEEMYALFEPAAEELHVIADKAHVSAEYFKNIKIEPMPTPDFLIAKPRRPIMAEVGYWWNDNKGRIALGMTAIAALFFYANQRNIKMLRDFTHDEDLVGRFEDWLGLEDEDERETPLNWKERQ